MSRNEQEAILERPDDRESRIPSVEPDLLERVEQAIEGNDEGTLRSIIEGMHPADRADLIEYFDEEERYHLLSLLGDDEIGETVLELPEEQREEFFEDLGAGRIARIIAELDPDDATDIIAELPADVADAVLERLGETDSASTADIRSLLLYGEETAGGRMTVDFVAVDRGATVAASIERVREVVAETGIDVYALYVVDEERRLCAYVRLQDLVLHAPSTPIERVMIDEVIAVEAGEDQELVAQLMARYDLLQVPVIDAEDRLIGLVTFDDIAEILEEEASEDILYLGGVTDDEESPTTPPLISMRRRLPWLVMNLGTAFIAAIVVAQFEETIARVTALAALMPIVAGMGGNASVQSIVVMVRALAFGDLGGSGKSRAIIKEGLVGLMNGTALGLLAGGVVTVMWGDMRLGAIIAAAMFVNLIVAGLVGTTIPLLLRRLKFDPALSSGPLATTFTDVCGFLTFLGLATLAIEWIT